MRRLCSVLVLLAILLCLIPASPVYADPDLPDSVTLEHTYYNRHLIENNDFLLMVHYNLYYSGAYPTPTADNVFVFRLYAPNGTTELGQALPYVYENGGYGQGVVAFYFSAIDAPTWNNTYIYVLKITGNPAVFGTPPTYTFNIPLDSWSTQTTQETNQAEVKDRVIVMARDLEIEWGIELLSQQDALIVFSAYGEAYFRNTIYGLQIMSPDLFYLQSEQMDTDDRTWSTDLSDDYKERFAGTWVEDSIESGASLFHAPVMLFLAIPVVGFSIYLIYKSKQNFGTTNPGVLAAAIMISGYSVLMLGMTLMAVVLLIMIWIAAFALFLRRA